MRILRLNPLRSILILSTLTGLTGCGSLSNYVPNIVKPYKFDIQQGNFITQTDIDKLQLGMSKDQVRFVLGTPLLNDAFHADRWDYVFRLKRANGTIEQSRYTVVFKDDKLVNQSGQSIPNTNAPENVTPAPSTGNAPTPNAAQSNNPSVTPEEVTGSETAPVLK